MQVNGCLLVNNKNHMEIKMPNNSLPKISTFLAIAGLSLLPQHVLADSYSAQAKKKSTAICPPDGWTEGLGVYMKAATKMPSAFQKNADDCDFNEWSWEAFIWATAKIDGIPRFMGLKTPSDLTAAKKGDGLLRLSSRSAPNHSTGFTEGAGAIVEADGSMLVGPNGYPVYASIHMNDSYFNTAKKNLIKDGGYTKNAGKDYFDVGAGVIKATWFRYDVSKGAPDGAYTTKAEVPVLQRVSSYSSGSQVVSSGEFEVVDVALVGVHVVGYVQHHPEFLWGTFEHKLNAPMLTDNTFQPKSSDKDSSTKYTFYKANTPYSEVLIANQPEKSSDPALLTFDDQTGKFSPVTQIVQMNKTGGDNRVHGPKNIQQINIGAQGYIAQPHIFEPAHFKQFSNYNLIGTLWMNPDTYVRSTTNWQDLDEANGQGAVNLANSTAETFMQQASNKVSGQSWGNCFECHNPKSFTYGDKGAKALAPRRIGISHIVSEGTTYAVPNMMPVIPLPLAVEKK